VRVAGWRAGRLRRARWWPSPNFGPRPPAETVDLVVVHSISLPPGVYGGDAVERLFRNELDFDEHPSYDEIRGLTVSAHFLIRRDGSLVQFVSCDDRAWHAGRSTWRGRPECNDYSIGIELEGLAGGPFDDPQYEQLARLVSDLGRRYPLRDIAGHEHVAPGRKDDPGAAFDWPRLQQRIIDPALRFPL
jgi:AmpD protein